MKLPVIYPNDRAIAVVLVAAVLCGLAVSIAFSFFVHPTVEFNPVVVLPSPVPATVTSGAGVTAAGGSQFALVIDYAQVSGNWSGSNATIGGNGTLTLASNSVNDINVSVRLYGYNGTTLVNESVVLAGTTQVNSTVSFSRVYAVVLNQTANGTVTVNDSNATAVTAFTVPRTVRAMYATMRLNDSALSVPQLNFTTDSIAVPEYTNLVAYLTSGSSTTAFPMQTQISYDNATWMLGNMAVIQSSGNTTKVEYTDKSVRYMRFIVNNTNVLQAVALKLALTGST